MRDLSNRVIQIEVGTKYFDNVFMSLLDMENIRYVVVTRNSLNYKPQREILEKEYSSYLSLMDLQEPDESIVLRTNGPYAESDREYLLSV